MTSPLSVSADRPEAAAAHTGSVLLRPWRETDIPFLQRLRKSIRLACATQGFCELIAHAA